MGGPMTSPVMPELEDIPELMRNARRWLVWKLEPDSKRPKPKKVPYYVNGSKRNGTLDSSQDMAQFATLEVAMQLLEKGDYTGLGFALGPDGTGNHWQGIDLDGLSQHPELLDVAARLPGFTEKSFSGDGWHAYGYGKHFASISYKKAGIEAYSAGRFFAFTADSAGLHGPCDLSDFVKSELVPLVTSKEGREDSDSRTGEATTTITPKQAADLRSALNAIPADDYGTWVNMGLALKQLGNTGRSLWLDWSQQSEEWQPADARKWDTFKPTNITYLSVFEEAQRHGWPNPRKNVTPAAPRVEPPATEVLDFAMFSLSGKSTEMREKMLNDVHVLGKIAILGQWTVFYAEPGSGKTLLTLWLLRESVRAGLVDPNRVFYLNCDDSYRGLVEKTKFAEDAGFHMLADGQEGFQAEAFPAVLESMIAHGTAHGSVIVMDTLKKFVDLMHKGDQTEFNKKLRSFVLAGGTIISLAHVNKYRDENGKPIASGTADVPQDCDCVYTMDKRKQGDKMFVTFERSGKARGDVAEKAVYAFDQYDGLAWPEMVETVRPVADEEMKALRRGEEVASLLSGNHKLIVAITEAIQTGTVKRTEIVDTVRESTGESKRRVMAVLDQHEGDDFLSGHRWISERGDKNAQVYSLLSGWSHTL